MVQMASSRWNEIQAFNCYIPSLILHMEKQFWMLRKFPEGSQLTRNRSWDAAPDPIVFLAILDCFELTSSFLHEYVYHFLFIYTHFFPKTFHIERSLRSYLNHFFPAVGISSITLWTGAWSPIILVCHTICSRFSTQFFL